MMPMYRSFSRLSSFGEAALGLGQFSELAVHGLNGVCGVNDPADILGGI